jgi:hypothetical protein
MDVFIIKNKNHGLWISTTIKKQLLIFKVIVHLEAFLLMKFLILCLICSNTKFHFQILLNKILLTIIIKLMKCQNQDLVNYLNNCKIHYMTFKKLEFNLELIKMEECCLEMRWGSEKQFKLFQLHICIGMIGHY